jgi:hypothetical protein
MALAKLRNEASGATWASRENGVEILFRCGESYALPPSPVGDQAAAFRDEWRGKGALAAKFGWLLGFPCSTVSNSTLIEGEGLIAFRSQES